ncbi:hypothetical protein SAY87_029862 [Trapa incisa]|uniref:Uncharacterized GPI-anchored protein At5g19230-like domain-containing protein n=1 Tax=Trapa incisa TaxID=236973 RepID=A0AAN7KCG4_9MYRT|nr:hypothetical protein SAY87_029862 [Trapa incisa]
MAILPLRLILSSVLLVFILSALPAARCDNEEDNLFQGINTYRASLNLTALTKNDNDQPCTNTTGANTIPGTENQLPNFPTLLEKCHLNVTNTRDGTIMPVCVPNLVPSLVLSNYTQSAIYPKSLNDTKYTGYRHSDHQHARGWLCARLV